MITKACSRFTADRRALQTLGVLATARNRYNSTRWCAWAGSRIRKPEHWLPRVVPKRINLTLAVGHKCPPKPVRATEHGDTVGKGMISPHARNPKTIAFQELAP